jgi:hypothetical protein
MLAILIAVLVSLGAAWFSWLFDIRLTGTRNSARIILALVLLAVCTWLNTLILASEYLVDHQNNAMFLFRTRVIAVFAVLISIIVAAAVVVVTVAAHFRRSSKGKWNQFLIPILALATFALALYLVDSRSFFPAV